MQAIVQHAYGTIDDVLRLQNIDEPTPGPHEVLVRVHAASVNHGDWFVTSGRPYVMRAALGLGRPRVAVRGRDLAGRVETVGEAVTRFRPGDDVYAETTTGTGAPSWERSQRLLCGVAIRASTVRASAGVHPLTGPSEDAQDLGRFMPGTAEPVGLLGLEFSDFAGIEDPVFRPQHQSHLTGQDVDPFMPFMGSGLRINLVDWNHDLPCLHAAGLSSQGDDSAPFYLAGFETDARVANVRGADEVV